LADFLPRLADIRTLIATSSTSRFSKAQSSDAHERSIAAKLEKAEDAIQTWAEANGVGWTILRPTMVYDCENDKNISRMARFIRRWRFLPIAAPAKGLRQPIHTDDVAKAAFLCLNNPDATNKAFNISGSEILPYRAMAERVFVALGQMPRFIPLPTALLQKAFRTAARLGLIKESSFGAEIFQRMNQDLIFDVAEGIKVLDYRPRPFKPEFFNVCRR
jgi:nucleoside-diphosphate-sugar epimerase